MRTAKWELAIALVLAAVLVALGAAFGGARKDDADVRRSTFVDTRRGLHALYLVAEACGANPRRAMSAPSADDPTNRTLVLAQPSSPVTKRDVARLAGWVDAGGRLVVVGGGPPIGAFELPTGALLLEFGIVQAPAVRIAGDELRIDGERLDDGLGRIDWPADWTVAANRSAEEIAPAEPVVALEPLVTRNGRCIAGRVARGERGGELVVIGDARLLDNESLAKEDNAVLALRLLLGRETIVFDEFHHGFREDGGADHLAGVVAAALVETWPGRAVIFVALAGAVFLAGAVVRFGAPEPDALPPRRSMSEHAEALGQILERSGARAEALRILAAGAVRAVGPRAGIPASLSPAEFAKRLRAAPAPGAGELAQTIERATAARAMRDSDFSTAAADLAAAKRRFLHGGQ